MTDTFTSYERGLQRLLDQLGPEHPQYATALVLHSRLLRNLQDTRRYGDSEASRAERATCLDQLNVLASEALTTSFNELCSGISESHERTAEITLSSVSDRDRRHEIDSLRRKLETLKSLQDVLGEQAVRNAKAELEARIDALIQTGGGAAFSGDVNNLGTIVGRDQHIGGDVVRSDKVMGSKWQIILGDYYDCTPDQVPPEALLEAYLRSLTAECSRLPLGVVDPRFFPPISETFETSVLLSDVYIDQEVLTLTRKEQDDDRRAFLERFTHADDRMRIPLVEAIVHPEITRFVLLGDPGSGKTTFINYLTYALANAMQGDQTLILPHGSPLQGMLPVRLILRDVAADCIPPQATRGTARMLWNALHADISARLGRDAGDALLPHLQQRLLKDGGLILLDGLDEVPIAEQRRQLLLEAMSNFAATLPPTHSRVVVTSRPYAYTDPQSRLPGFEVLSIAPFNEHQVERFVNLWYETIRPTMAWDQSVARERGSRLMEALRQRPYLADLAARPLLLTLMTTLHTSWGQLPEDRADLYEEAVKLLLARWQQARAMRGLDEKLIEPGVVKSLEVEKDRIRVALHRLAYIAHKQQESSKQEMALASIGEDEIVAAFSSVLPEDSVGAVLNYVETRAGLLVGVAPGVYAFPHRSFQEYLTACYLVEQPEPIESLSSHARMDPDYWGEIFLLGVGKLRQGGLGNALSAIANLLPVGSDRIEEKTELDWRIALLAARAVLDVVRPISIVQERPLHRVLLERIRQWLDELVRTPGALPEREQREAYEVAEKFFTQETPEEPVVLGWLGDTRFSYYTRTGNLADLEAAVLLYRKATNRVSEEHTHYVTWLESLTAALQDLYSRTGDIDSLYEIVESRRKFLSCSVREPSLRSQDLRNLGRALCNLYGSDPKGDYLEQALDLYQQAMAIASGVSQETQDLWREYERAQHIYAQHRFFSLWDNVEVEDRKQRILQFCELLSEIVGAKLLDFQALPQGSLFLGILDLRDLFEEIPLPSIDSFPILFSAAKSIDLDYLDRIRQALNAQLGPNSRTALLVPISRDQELSSVRSLVKGAIRQAYAYDIVCLHQSDLETIVKSSNPSVTLRHLVLSQTNLDAVPVYKSSGSTPINMFFGREPELKEICHHIKSTDYVLIGGRRIGKTSILKQLERARLPDAGFHAFYHECSFTPTQEELVQAVITDKSWFPEPPAEMPLSLADVIYTLPDDRLPVILFDETDKLIESDLGAGYPIFNTLRALSNADRCRFVLCGERALRAERTSPDSPLYNFGSEMLIGRLERHAVTELVTKPMSWLEITLSDESAMVERIWDLTSGHPSVVQSLCDRLLRRLSQRGDRSLKLEDLEAVVADPGFLRKDYLDVFWERATVLECLCSLVMAADQNARTLPNIYEALSGRDVEVTLNHVDGALEKLVDLRNILKRTAEGYEFAVPAFPEVIAKTARLDDLIALKRETYRLYGDVEPSSERRAT